MPEKKKILGIADILQVLYICVSFWLLAHDAHDLSKSEMKIIVFKSWTNELFFPQNGQVW